MLSWHRLRLEAVCGWVARRQGGLCVRSRGGLGVGKRQREENEGTNGADARGTTPRFMFEGILHGGVPVAGTAGGG